MSLISVALIDDGDCRQGVGWALAKHTVGEKDAEGAMELAGYGPGAVMKTCPVSELKHHAVATRKPHTAARDTEAFPFLSPPAAGVTG